MESHTTFDARYFDGKSGHAQSATVRVTEDGLNIDAERESVHWFYRDLISGPKRAADIRLGNRKFPDASLVLPAAASNALMAAAPLLFSGVQERNRMAGLIAALVAGAALVTAGVFWGVPAISGPLANRTPKDLEVQIGENLAAQINTFLKPCGDEKALSVIRPVVEELAATGNVGFPITFKFVRAAAPNAMALPGGQVMATSGLLEAIGDDQEAFLAVIAHELGHVRARDGMRAVYRNAGLGAALEIITGGSGAAQQLVLVGGQLSQLRHTRVQERAADEAAMEILAAAGHDPAALARAFEAITGYDYSPEEDADNDKSDLPTWLRTHPDTDERIKAANARQSTPGAPPLSDEDWRRVLAACPKKADGEDDQKED